MIEQKDILSVPFLKKSPFTGSYEGMRFCFTQKKEEEEACLEVTAWEGPYNSQVTPEEKKHYKKVPFTEEGIQQGIDWLNELWRSDPERFRRAKTDW